MCVCVCVCVCVCAVCVCMCVYEEWCDRGERDREKQRRIDIQLEPTCQHALSSLALYMQAISCVPVQVLPARYLPYDSELGSGSQWFVDNQPCLVTSGEGSTWR